MDRTHAKTLAGVSAHSSHLLCCQCPGALTHQLSSCSCPPPQEASPLLHLWKWEDFILQQLRHWSKDFYWINLSDPVFLHKAPWLRRVVFYLAEMRCFQNQSLLQQKPWKYPVLCPHSNAADLFALKSCQPFIFLSLQKDSLTLAKHPKWAWELPPQSK